ncbi:MAG: hypothetical protein WC538_14050 [Thermoanaerobaculia bacterium]|jgi:hypothetical protein
MNIERVLTDDARSRRGCGWLILICGGLVAGGMIFAMVIQRLVTAPGIVILVLLLGGIALGVRFALKPGDYLEVDLDARTYVHVRDHERRPSRPLNALGTLVVSERMRTVRTKNGTKTVTEYAVHPEGKIDLDFRVVKSAGEARLILETLARRWRLPSAAWGGDVRQPDQLDMPLHERLRGSEKHRSEAPMEPTWNLRVEPLSPGYAIVSSHRDWSAVLASSILGIPLSIAIVLFARGELWSSIFRQGERDPLALVIGAIMAVLSLGFVGWELKLLRDTLAPGTIRITPDGVSYRGRTMRFEEIEEVIGGDSIEIVGDRRLLKLAPTFCAAAAVPSLCHEVERMIIEVGNAVRIG